MVGRAARASSRPPGAGRWAARRLKATWTPPAVTAYSRVTAGIRPRDRAASGQALLEPVVGVRLVVEWRHLLVAGRAVEADRFGEGLVGVELHRPGAAAAGVGLERVEQPPAEAQATRGRRHPQTL